MNGLSDQQLLRDYAGSHSEVAFAELVRRHIDLVHSAAVRMTCNAHLAQDVVQGTFVALAQQAAELTDRPVLSGWLHRTAQNIACKAVRSEERRRAREQEAATMNELLATGSEAPWEQIAPHLDAALGDLSEPDRDALLLRYFERKSAEEIGQVLGISDETAQKRVSRAVERLRAFLAKRGVAAGAGGIAFVLSANAVQSAPAGLAAAISTAALAGATIATTSTLITTSKAIAMTTLQKTLVAATVAVLAGAGIYQTRQGAQLRNQLQALQQEKAPLAEQIQQLQAGFADATNRLATLLTDSQRLTANPQETELLKLRGQVTTLRTDAANRAQSDQSLASMMKSPEIQDLMKAGMGGMVDKVYARLFADLHLSPEQISALKKLLLDKTNAGMDSGAEMLSGKSTPAQLQAIDDRIAAEKAGADAQIKQLLGAEGFAAYQAYDKSYNERAAVVGPAGFAEQLAGGLELTPEQTEQLIQVMADTRQNFKFTVDYSDKSEWASGMAAMYSDENMNLYQHQLDERDQLFVSHAQNILSPDQLASFNKFLSGRTAMGLMSVRMVAKMLSASSGGN